LRYQSGDWEREESLSFPLVTNLLIRNGGSCVANREIGNVKKKFALKPLKFAGITILAERLNSLAERLNSLAERLNSLAERLNSLAERLNSLAERLNSLAERPNSLAEHPNSLAEHPLLSGCMA
jgi:predicted nuclease with TOPRIM domain